MNRTRNSLLALVVTLVLITLFSSCKTNIAEQEIEMTASSLETGVKSSLEIPKPANGMSVVFGRIIEKKTNLPPQNAIFLAENITAGEEDLPVYFTFSHQSSPRAAVDENGFFVIKDVPEGQFAILLFEPTGDHRFVDNGQTGDELDYIWINAVPNETIDLGTIYVP